MPAERAEDEPLLGSGTKQISSRLVTVEPLIFILAAVVGPMFVIVVPQYVEYRLAQERNFTLVKDDAVNGTCTDQNASANPDYETRQEIADETAYWLMIKSAFTYIPALFVSPFYGALGDRLGRKLHLLIPVVTSLLSLCLKLVVVYNDLPLILLASSAIITGFGGGFCFFMAGCYSYIADITDEKSRILRIAVVNTTGAVSYGIAPLLFGYFVDACGFIPPMWCGVAFYILAILYIITPGCLQEPLRRKARPELRMNLISNTMRGVLKLFNENGQNRRSRLSLFLLIYFFANIVQLSAGALQIFTIYGLGPPFCWSSVTLGYFSFTSLTASSLGALIGSKLLPKCLGDIWILQIAYIFGIIYYMIAAWAPSTIIFILGSVVGSLRGMEGPILYTILSKLVTPEEQGVVFAVEASVQSFANVVSPLIWNSVYSATVETQPNFVFYIMGCVFVILIGVSWIWFLYSKKMMGGDFKSRSGFRELHESSQEIDNTEGNHIASDGK